MRAAKRSTHFVSSKSAIGIALGFGLFFIYDRIDYFTPKAIIVVNLVFGEMERNV